MTKISIVIPYWNGAEKIQRYLPDVLKFARTNNVEEVIASDDSSTDDTVQLLKNEFPDVVVIEREHNEGFSSNVNTGFSKAKGDFVFLINSDAMPGEAVFKYAMPHFDDKRVFSVGCNTGGLWAIGGFKNGFFWHDQARKAGPCEATVHQTLWVSGGSGVFRKSMWDKMGGLDELYNPFYVEDLDLGYRATKRGYINIWEPKSKVDHYTEKGVIESNFSRDKINYTAERNMLIFIWKNITNEKLISDHKLALTKRLFSHPKYWLVFLAALRQYPAIMRKREIEKQEAKLSDEEIFGIFEGV